MNLIRNIRIFLLLFLLSGFPIWDNNCLAYTPSETKPAIKTDTLSRTSRSLDPEQRKELFTDVDYNYDRKDGPEPLSAWDKFWEWLFRKLGESSDSKSGAIGFRVLQYILLAGAIAAVIVLLLKNNIRALFYGKSAKIAIDFKEFEEDIHAINFDTLITEAVQKKDFRKAIRLHFLKLLKELTDKNLIKWQIDKTNNDYSMELANTSYRVQFRELANLYEYVWYGAFQLDEENFRQTVSKFRKFSV